ncbi:SHOCT domain-containing protein [Enterococcus faecium]|uniref:SHOCT domain-containing protein n=1 Tax=Enterococcus faecium TaxID=1352 RepID=UPI003CE4B736
MNIYEVKDGCPLKGKTDQMTEEELQKEYDFHIADSIVGMLYKEGKITQDELHKISALNRQKFSPKLAEIMS